MNGLVHSIIVLCFQNNLFNGTKELVVLTKAIQRVASQKPSPAKTKSYLTSTNSQNNF